MTNRTQCKTCLNAADSPAKKCALEHFEGNCCKCHLRKTLTLIELIERLEDEPVSAPSEVRRAA